MQNKLAFALSTSQDIQKIFDEYLNKTVLNENVEKTKAKIDQKFDEIIKALNVRKNELNQEIDQFQTNKIEQIKEKKLNINKYQDEIKEVSTKYNDEQGEEIKLPKILTDDKYKKYQNTKDITDFLANSITETDINFDTNIDLNNIDSFGNVKIGFMNKLFKPKKINLLPIIKQEGESINGYKIRLKWKIENDTDDSKEEQLTFVIKYKYDKFTTAGNGDDEKVTDDGSIWEILNYTQVESSDGINFELSIMDKTFEINTLYSFRIECLSTNPYHLELISNIERICIDFDDRPKGKIVKIPLIYSSHRSDNNGPPSNMLQKDDSYYWSSFYNDFEKGEDDWIVFKFDNGDQSDKENKDIFPLRFEILNNSGYQKQGVKNMNLLIGNTKTDEWYQYNEGLQDIEILKTDEMQSFNLSGVNSKIIKNKQLNGIKLQLTRNWGFREDFGSKYAIKEFHLYGIRF